MREVEGDRGEYSYLLGNVPMKFMKSALFILIKSKKNEK